MRYQLAPLYCRPWTLNGISARLIESHYENNYGAALTTLFASARPCDIAFQYPAISRVTQF